VVTLSLEFSDELRTPQIEEPVRSVEARIRDKYPEVIVLFVKPQSHAGFRAAASATAEPHAAWRLPDVGG
jgi:hypothetical protein